MERPGSMMSVRPRDDTRSRTVSMRSLGVGSTSPLQASKHSQSRTGQGRHHRHSHAAAAAAAGGKSHE